MDQEMGLQNMTTTERMDNLDALLGDIEQIPQNAKEFNPGVATAKNCARVARERLTALRQQVAEMERELVASIKAAQDANGQVEPLLDQIATLEATVAKLTEERVRFWETMRAINVDGLGLSDPLADAAHELPEDWQRFPTTSAAVAALRAERDATQRIVDAVDDVLVVNWVGPRVDGDYRRALADLVTFAIQIHDNPEVSEVARERAEQLVARGSRIETLEGALRKALDRLGAIDRLASLRGQHDSVIAAGEAALRGEKEPG